MIESRFAVETGPATGRHLKELAEVPVDFALYRRARGGNEPTHDEDLVDVRNGDHFFAARRDKPPSGPNARIARAIGRVRECA